MFLLSFIYLFFIHTSIINGQYETNYWSNRTGMVHLFEWKFNDIADECERFLAPAGFAGVQLSPVTENSIINNRPWWERYQPISYKLVTRSGNKQELQEMLDRCNKVGVRIYVDVVINHMAAGNGVLTGTDGSKAYLSQWYFPSVPYVRSDFNPACDIQNWNDPYELRNCQLVSLLDLNQTKLIVQQKIITYLNELIDMGVGGFRIDAAKHMWPKNLQIIYMRLNNLSTKYFSVNARPFIFQEVSGSGLKNEYTTLGAVTEFEYSQKIGQTFRGSIDLKYLRNWGPSSWGFLPSFAAFVFVCNHDNQREDFSNIIIYKEPLKFKMATAFMLAHPYGIPRIMSSYDFQNFDQGPPADPITGEILSPIISPITNQCDDNWVCEHRWSEIVAIIKFRNLVKGEPITDWWNNESNLIGFSRGQKGAIYFNNQDEDVQLEIQVKLPAGIYCDVFTGNLLGNMCTGLNVTISKNGRGVLDLRKDNGVFAFHIEARI